MSETLTVELTNEQRDLLLRGLRFVRSGVVLEPREPSPEVTSEREQRLHEITMLVQQLNDAQPAKATAHV